MANKESTFSGMFITLSLITLISSALLGVVYELTRKPIEIAMLAKKNSALKRVLPEFNNDPQQTMYKVASDDDTLYIYPAMLNHDTVGYAVETFSKKAFGGTLKLLVGFLPDGSIKETAVLQHKETPGLGDKMLPSKSKWNQQFKGVNPDKFKLIVKKDGGDVDAISGSTITSRAYCDALQRAYDAYKKGGNQ